MVSLSGSIDLHRDVQKAIAAGDPVLALESTILAHGMPYPQNLEFALVAEQIVKSKGVVPATIAILDGIIKVGLEESQLKKIAESEDVEKVAVRDLPYIMAGKKNDRQTVTVEPIHVASRQSTDILAINDADVVQAVRFIRLNSKRLIQVSDVLNEVGCSRRNLHRKFERILGRSVHKEIKRMRIETICQMLLETDLPISHIALTFGYQSADHIARFFKQEKGVTPLAYRKQYAKQ